MPQAASATCLRHSTPRFCWLSLCKLVCRPLKTKQCSKCKQVLPVEMFHKNKSRSDSLSSQCKQCRNQYVIDNPVLTQTNTMVKDARRRAKTKGLSFDIDHDYIRSIVPSHCPIFGMPLEWSALRGGRPVPLPNSPSLDRIDPTRGYVQGNVWIISNRANQIKNDASHEELKLVAKAVGQAIVDSLEF
jgi:hypothetical protein